MTGRRGRGADMPVTREATTTPNEGFADRAADHLIRPLPITGV